MDVTQSMLLAASPPLRETFAGIGLPRAIMLALAAIGFLAVLLSGWARLRRRLSARSAVAGPVQQRAAESAVRDVEELMTRLDDLAAQIHRRLDAKLARLESALREADQRVDCLTRLMRQADGQPVVDVTLEEVDPLATQPAASSPTAHVEVFRLADSGRAPLEIARQTGLPTGEVELILSLRRAKSLQSDEPAHATRRLQRAG
jgi:hypothetical protein